MENGWQSMTFALIDIGSNTIRLSAYALGEQAAQIAGRMPSDSADDLGGFVRLFSKKVMAQLAGYVDERNCLSEEGIERACSALAYLETLPANLGIERCYAFATASLRNIDNRDEALERIERASGLSIDVLSGQEEALLGYSSFIHEHALDEGLVVDIGGGSAELVCFSAGEVLASRSIPLGSLKLYKRDVRGVLPTKKEARAIRSRVQDALDEAGFSHPEPCGTLCAIGGTARAVGKLMRQCGLCGRDANVFPVKRLSTLADLLVCEQDRALELVLRTCPERVHTLVPGTVELLAIATRFSARDIIVGKYGVREGYVYERIIG